MNITIQKILRKPWAILLIVVLLVIVGLALYTFFGNVFKAGDDGNGVITSTNINPSIAAKSTPAATILTTGGTSPSTKPTSTASTKPTKAAATRSTRATSATRATRPQTTRNIQYATAIPPESPADYQAQWDAGYLIAIDNPDPSYSCPHIELSDEDRDLLERLCMGEFGGGGIIGAALIAQSVKDAMCFDGYTTVEDVIKYCRYDGDTNRGTNDDCRMAVRFVFDHDGDAVQHRLMYMYNPYLVDSDFHESQNYILSYENVRFFDRWGY